MLKAAKERVLTHPEPILTAVVLPLSLWLTGSRDGGGHVEAQALALAAAAWLPLIIRRRYPLPVLAVVTTMDIARAIITGHNDPASGTLPLATMLAVYTVAAESTPAVAWRCATAVGVAQFAAAEIAFKHSSIDVLYLNWALLGTAIGALIRERHRRLVAAEQRAEEAERTRETEARRQVTAERVRIARELHDSLAHHITVVNAQAGVAQYLMRTDPYAAEAALAGITQNTREALDELRATLGLLRDEQTETDGLSARTPTPGFDRIEELAAGFQDAGVAVAINQYGNPRALTGVIDLAAYRIVQEALSNATRHAPGATIQIDIRWSAHDLALTIVNGPSIAVRESVSHGTGHGMIGMRERANAAGGTLSAESTSSGGFIVVAHLPLAESPDASLSTGSADPVGLTDSPEQAP